MDETVSRFPAEMLGHLGETDLRTLVSLLERARIHCDSRTSPTCEGTGPSVTCDGTNPGTPKQP
jgi:hypothetical protein